MKVLPDVMSDLFIVEDIGGAGELIGLMHYRRFVGPDVPATGVPKAQIEEHPKA
jgi:hypothetical protein